MLFYTIFFTHMHMVCTWPRRVFLGLVQRSLALIIIISCKDEGGAQKLGHFYRCILPSIHFVPSAFEPSPLAECLGQCSLPALQMVPS